MQKVTITIKDDSKLKALIQFLREIDFVEISRAEKSRNIYRNRKFDELFGIWKDRSISISDLRKQAWERNP